MSDICAVTGLFHVLVKSNDLPQTLKFYKDVLGLREAPRPAFGNPGAWMAVSTPIGEQIIHVWAGGAGMGPTGKTPYGTAAIDHVSLLAIGHEGFRGRFMKFRLPWREFIIPNTSLWQLFVYDPSGVQIELTFDAGMEPSRTARSRRRTRYTPGENFFDQAPIRSSDLHKHSTGSFDKLGATTRQHEPFLSIDVCSLQPPIFVAIKSTVGTDSPCRMAIDQDLLSTVGLAGIRPTLCRARNTGATPMGRRFVRRNPDPNYRAALSSPPPTAAGAVSWTNLTIINGHGRRRRCASSPGPAMTRSRSSASSRRPTRSRSSSRTTSAASRCCSSIAQSPKGTFDAIISDAEYVQKFVAQKALVPLNKADFPHLAEFHPAYQDFAPLRAPERQDLGHRDALQLLRHLLQHEIRERGGGEQLEQPVRCRSSRTRW